MRYRNRRGGRSVPPSVDALFAAALEGRKSGSGRGGNARQEQKARQLCRQVQRALSLALAGECADDVLRELYVESVEPAPDSGHLVVRVVVPRGTAVVGVLGRLEHAAGRLRATVAAAITRKRAPELTFVPVAGGGEGVGDEHE